MVVIAAHRFDRRYPPQLGECFFPVYVARVQDQVDSVENLQDARRQPIKKLGAVRIGDDADACRVRGAS